MASTGTPRRRVTRREQKQKIGCAAMGFVAETTRALRVVARGPARNLACRADGKEFACANRENEATHLAGARRVCYKFWN